MDKVQVSRWQNFRDSLSEYKLVDYKFCKQDVELIYNALDFYQKNRPKSSERPLNMQEPSGHLYWMKQSMTSLMNKSNFQKK